MPLEVRCFPCREKFIRRTIVQKGERTEPSNEPSCSSLHYWANAPIAMPPDTNRTLGTPWSPYSLEPFQSMKFKETEFLSEPIKLEKLR